MRHMLRIRPVGSLHNMLNSMYAYADHNFLIDCTVRPAWEQAVVSACQKGRVTLILSPFHFYEIGNIRRQDHRDQVLAFLDKVKPLWILERLDIQLQEFITAWFEFFKRPAPFVPRYIGSLADAASAILDTDSAKLQRLELRHFVAEFTEERVERVLLPMLDKQRLIAASNRDDVKAGKLTQEMRFRVETAYIAQQIALQEGHLREDDVTRRVQVLLGNRFLLADIERFIRSGRLAKLRTYQVETVFTELFYSGNAALNKHRFLDRQHAVIALAHCSVLVTGDEELRKTCNRARALLPFRTAAVDSGEEFVAKLALTAGKA